MVDQKGVQFDNKYCRPVIAEKIIERDIIQCFQ